MQPDILTPRQVGEIFGVHPTTVKKWADKGQIIGFKTPGGHYRFRRADVEALKATTTGEAGSVGVA